MVMNGETGMTKIGKKMNELEEWVDKPYKEARRLFDEYYLRIQVEKTKGDISAAALRAGIHRTMFYRKIIRKEKE